MTAELESDAQLEIGHVLFMDIVGFSKLMVDEQTDCSQRLNQIVRNTEQFRAAEAANKLIRLPTGDGFLVDRAIVYCWLGERDQALRQLEELAKTSHGLSYGELRFGPDWDSLRGNPRFEKIVASLAPK